MGKAESVVTAVLVQGRTRSEVAREYGISRRWLITLVQRFLAEGEAGLRPRSRRPHLSPNRTSIELEDEIVAIRKELDRGGHEAGAETIAAHLQRRHGHAPAVSTIWRILTARGFVTAQPHKRPKGSGRRFVAAQPNERWQADITHWRLADGTVVEICNWLDDHSRFCLASTAARTFTAAAVDRAYRAAAEHHGDPASVLTDNGSVFTGRIRGGRAALELTLAARGALAVHSRANHPQTCGKVERFHQTQKKWLTTQPPADTVTALHDQLEHFRGYYNTERPHRALHRHTPAEAYTATPKAAPGPGPLTDGHYRLGHPTIDANGTIAVRYNSRRYRIGIGRRHTGTPVTVLIRDRHIRVLNPRGELLRELTLDPDRPYQPRPRL